MNRREFLERAAGGIALGATAMPRGWSEAAKPARRPNIVVVFTDDQGYADLRCQGQVDDLKTPNLDRLAAEGVRCTDGYVTAPQCCPSRAGLITGRYQQRFGLDENGLAPLSLEETTIADRLGAAGYATGTVGKWHLEPHALSIPWAREHVPEAKPNKQGRIAVPREAQLPYEPGHRGFADYFNGTMRTYWANFGLDGKDRDDADAHVEDKRLRLDVQTDAALAFIDRHKDEPFFLYLAYFAPHTPLEATEEYLARFPEDMPTRRRYALAMLAAIDDGVGRVLDRLADHGLDEDTLIFFISDNGAPLKLTMADAPIDTDPGGWDGSLNTPWVGEKGMLSEGGIRVPYLVQWKGHLPEGTLYRKPVTSLDVAATALAAAGVDQPEALDGVNLLPYLARDTDGAPHDALYWRFWNQSAVRRGRWKYLQVGDAAQYLFDLEDAAHEHANVIDAHPDIADDLRARLGAWAAELATPGVPDGAINQQEAQFFGHFFGLNTDAPVVPRRAGKG